MSRANIARSAKPMTFAPVIASGAGAGWVLMGLVVHRGSPVTHATAGTPPVLKTKLTRVSSPRAPSALTCTV